MNIAWTFDKDTISGIDPLGDLVITGDDERSVLVKCVYLDSWFEAMIQGFRSMSEKEKAAIEIVEEPEPLLFERIGTGLRLTYERNSIVINDMQQAVQELRSACKKFLVATVSKPDADKNDILKRIDEFISLIER